MTNREHILKLAEDRGMIRAQDVQAAGISRNYLYEMHKDGLLVKVSRGIYMLPEAPITEHSHLAELATRVPHGVVCLLSALSFHEIGTQLPHKIWLAVPRGSWRPDIDYPPVNLIYLSGEAYSFGIEEHILNKVTVRVYSPAKTVADCFKFRNKIGLDVAIEALREVGRYRKATADELYIAARANRVHRVMMPYMEAII